MNVVFTNGCFDILHSAHVLLLQYCRDLAGEGQVVVGLNSDESVLKLKGSSRPINKQSDRKFLLESLKYVDKVVIFNELEPLKLIESLKPDFIVKGGDYNEEEVAGRNHAKVKIFNYVNGYSTTKTIESITNR